MRLTLIFLAITTACFAQDPYKNIYTANAWAARDKWQKADELIAYLRITEGSQVADIGCHEGYMSLKLARMVGSNGKVFAVDVEQSKLDKLTLHAKEQHVTNIRAVKGDYDNPKLPANALDAVIILDTYHEMHDHDKILQHVKASLKTGGRLVICEPIAEERRELPRASQEKKHEIGIRYVIDDLEKAGFHIELRRDPYIDRTKEKGDKMWIIVATRD
jgi:ubiquinone/menaquinone biosynthesis C-methylase UbiE